MVKIDISEYEEKGLSDIYYTLLSFMQKYVSSNFDFSEIYQISIDKQTKYAFAFNNMKQSIKDLLDYFKSHNEVYLENINKIVDLNTINIEEQQALIEMCEKYMVAQLEASLKLLPKDLH